MLYFLSPISFNFFPFWNSRLQELELNILIISLENREEKEISEATISWKVKHHMGREVQTSELPGITNVSNSKELKISKATTDLNSYIGQCVANYENQDYFSRYFMFDVNRRNIGETILF